MTASTWTLRLKRSFELALVMAKIEAETKCGIASSEAAASTYTDRQKRCHDGLHIAYVQAVNLKALLLSMLEVIEVFAIKLLQLHTLSTVDRLNLVLSILLHNSKCWCADRQVTDRSPAGERHFCMHVGHATTGHISGSYTASDEQVQGAVSVHQQQ